MSKIYTSADQLIGKTPLLELTHIEQAEKLETRVLAKLEYFNPAGQGPAEARLRHHRADLRQHGHRPCLRGRRARLPHHHRHA